MLKDYGNNACTAPIGQLFLQIKETAGNEENNRPASQPLDA